MNNGACSRLGTMLHLETQKDKEAMKTSGYQNDMGGNSVCMKRIMMDTNGVAS